jgi:mannose-6-phosphate isomerase-like protein (cupin superfamily)
VAAWLTEPLAECAGGRLARARVTGEVAGTAACTEFHYANGRCASFAAGQTFRYQGLTLIVISALDSTEAAGMAAVGDQPMLLAPDGSEIRPLLSVPAASVVHCTLPPGAVSQADRHHTVEEGWYVLSGEGELWREAGTVALRRGVATTIPLPGAFQFRAGDAEPLVILIGTFPAWPGPREAAAVHGPW